MGLFGSLQKLLSFLFILGLAVAVMRVFNWDPFGAITWVFNVLYAIVDRTADFFTSNETFRSIFADNPFR